MPDNPSNREFTARDIVPILALIAFVVVNLFGKWPRLSWILVVVAVFFGILDHYSTLKAQLLKWKARRDDRRTIKKAFPEFQRLVGRFRQFANRQAQDTLHYIVAYEIQQGRADVQTAPQLPNVDLWYVPMDFFVERLNRMPRTMEEFRPALMEFHFLVGTYNTFCVSPIFDRLPANVRAQLQPAIVRKLNLFQQQFSRYLEDYQLFARGLSESRPILQGLPSDFPMPGPMV
jgi:hypothetical protein